MAPRENWSTSQYEETSQYMLSPSIGCFETSARAFRHMRAKATSRSRETHEHPQQRPNHQAPVLAVLFRAAINRGSILHARISNDEKAKVAVEVASNGEQDK
jgi:hypothetical protein